MANNPAYSSGDVVYLRESAALGFIESYQIDGIYYDNTNRQWIYTIDVRHRGPAPSTTIDRVDLRNRERLRFREDELVGFCEAIQLAIDETENRLSKLQSIRDAQCSESSE